jgi:hypothetical protein
MPQNGQPIIEGRKRLHLRNEVNPVAWLVESIIIVDEDIACGPSDLVPKEQ